MPAPDGSFYVLDGYGTSLVLHYDAGGAVAAGLRRTR